jgi:hypothetical protein
MLSKKVRSTLRWLRRHDPATMPVVVREATGLDCHGICVIGDERALIRLSSRDSEVVQRDSLLEEWAHVLRAECPVKCRDPHDHIFWGILAAITKHYRGETDEWHEVDG